MSTGWDFCLLLSIPDERFPFNQPDDDVADLVPPRTPWMVTQFFNMTLILRGVDLPVFYLDGTAIDIGLAEEVPDWSGEKTFRRGNDYLYLKSRRMVPDEEYENTWRLRLFLGGHDIDFKNWPDPESAAIGSIALVRELRAKGWEVVEGTTFEEFEEYAAWCKEHWTIEREVASLRHGLETDPGSLLEQAP